MVRTADHLVNEMEKKLELIDMLRTQCEEQINSTDYNLMTVKSQIDQSVSFHLHNLQKRGDWLKSHAEHVCAIMQESLSQRLQQLSCASSEILGCLENTEGYEEQQIRQALNGSLSKIDLSNFGHVNDILSFHGDDNILREAVLAFGSITTSLKDDTNSTESFILADDERDGIEIISKEECNSVAVSEWLVKKSLAPESKELSSFEVNTEDDQRWLCASSCKESSEKESEFSSWLSRKSDCDSGRFSDNDSVVSGQDSACFLLQNMRIEEHSSTVDSEDYSIYLYPGDRSPEISTRPQPAFLDHWDFLANLDASCYLVPKKTNTSLATPSDDDKCKWLIRRDGCEKEKCTSDGCDLFDKNWLRVAKDW